MNDSDIAAVIRLAGKVELMRGTGRAIGPVGRLLEADPYNPYLMHLEESTTRHSADRRAELSRLLGVDLAMLLTRAALSDEAIRAILTEAVNLQNGSDMSEGPAVVWRKATKCDNSSGNCVEVAAIGKAVAIRDSKNPTGPVLVYTAAEWTSFIDGIQGGEFDDLLA